MNKFPGICFRCFQARLIPVLTLVLSLLCSRAAAHIPISPLRVVLIGTATNAAAYTAEMLTAEGFRNIEIIQTADVESSHRHLGAADLVILPHTALTPVASRLLFGYVRKGGALLCFLPDPSLSKMLGVGVPVQDTARSGYLQMSTPRSLTAGFSRQPLQWHGEACRYRIDKSSKAAVVALFCDNDKKVSEYPAIIRNRYGRGEVIAFLYDLPLSILYTRQGDPGLAGKETDGINGIRAMDMFTGNWVDTANNTLNQADEQQQLFARCIETLTLRGGPQPRFWYFPDTLKSLVVLTNDGEYQSEKDFAPQFADVAAKNARMTLYLLQPEKISARFADSLTKLGFEIAAHPDATSIATLPGWRGVDQAISGKLSRVRTLTAVPEIRTNTNHWFVWCGTDSNGIPDFSAGAEIEAKNGIRMDVNYAHYDNKSVQPRFLGSTGYRQGNFTGSGLPMKFGSATGKTIDVYQLFNNVYDQQYMENQDPEGYESCFRGLLDRSLTDDVYSYVCIRAHNDEYFFSKAPLMRMLDYAAVRHIPVWPVSDVLRFLTARDSATIDKTTWDETTLRFRVTVPVACSVGLGLTLPAEFSGKKLSSVSVSGRALPWTVTMIKKKNYGRFTIGPGSTTIKADYQ